MSKKLPTFIEICVIIIILGILSAIAIPAYRSYHARINSLKPKSEYQCIWTSIEWRDVGLSPFDMTLGLHGKKSILYPLCWKPGKGHIPTVVINHHETWPDILHMETEWSRCKDDFDFGLIKNANQCKWGTPGWFPPIPNTDIKT